MEIAVSIITWATIVALCAAWFVFKSNREIDDTENIDPQKTNGEILLASTLDDFQVGENEVLQYALSMDVICENKKIPTSMIKYIIRNEDIIIIDVDMKK
jgi:hypothetical protein